MLAKWGTGEQVRERARARRRCHRGAARSDPCRIPISLPLPAANTVSSRTRRSVPPCPSEPFDAGWLTGASSPSARASTASPALRSRGSSASWRRASRDRARARRSGPRPRCGCLRVSTARCSSSRCRAHAGRAWPRWWCTRARCGVPTTSGAVPGSRSRPSRGRSATSPRSHRRPVVERAVDDALRRRLVTLRSLQRVADALDGKGRLRCTVTRGILRGRQPGFDPGGSPAELRIVRLLVRAGLPKPVQQWRVRFQGRTARADLAYPELGIVMEYDGWDYHSPRTVFDSDRPRGNDFELLELTVLRVHVGVDRRLHREDRASGLREGAQQASICRFRATCGIETTDVRGKERSGDAAVRQTPVAGVSATPHCPQWVMGLASSHGRRARRGRRPTACESRQTGLDASQPVPRDEGGRRPPDLHAGSGGARGGGALPGEHGTRGADRSKPSRSVADGPSPAWLTSTSTRSQIRH